MKRIIDDAERIRVVAHTMAYRLHRTHPDYKPTSRKADYVEYLKRAAPDVHQTLMEDAAAILAALDESTP